MKNVLAVSFASTLALALAPLAQADVPQYGVNSSVNLSQLQSSGTPQVATSRNDDLYTVDASAVMNVVPNRFLAVSVDFDHQHQIGIPEITESHLVARNGDELYAWVHMQATGSDSQHYLDVRLASGLGSGALGAQWQMVRSSQVPSGASFPDSPAFGSINGSLYVMPMGDGNPDEKQPCYVRYYAQAQVNSWLPNWLISSFVQNHFVSDVQSGLRAIAAQAQ